MKKIIVCLLSMPFWLNAQISYLYSFIRLNDIGVAMDSPVSLTIGQNAYVGLGNHGNIPSDNLNFYKYDPTNDSWTLSNAVAYFPGDGPFHAAAFSVNNMGYVVCGYSLTKYPSGEVHLDMII